MITSFLFWIIKDCLFLLGYISGRQSFCKPLNPEEERAALLRMREGRGGGIVCGGPVGLILDSSPAASLPRAGCSLCS